MALHGGPWAQAGARGGRGGALALSSALPVSALPAGSTSMIAADLAASLGTVRRPGDVFAAGTAELLAPLVEVEGVGPVALPLLPTRARRIIAAADPAPYGRGAETVLDPAVTRAAPSSAAATPKAPGVSAAHAVAPPPPFAGGELVARHKGREPARPGVLVRSPGPP